MIESHRPMITTVVQAQHLGQGLYNFIKESKQGNIKPSDKIHSFINLTHEGYAIAVPDIFNVFSTRKNANPKAVEACFYALNKHKASSYTVTFPIGKKKSVILPEL